MAGKRYVKRYRTKRGYRYYSLNQKKWIPKKTYKRLATLQKKYSPSFKTSLTYYKTKIPKAKKESWRTFRPEPEVKARIKPIRKNVDLIRSGGVGRLFAGADFEKQIKKVKFRKGAKRAIRITGYARDKKGRIIKDKKINIEVTVNKGQRSSTLVKAAYTRLKQQVESYGWKVSPKLRSKKRIRGENIKSLKLDFSIVGYK